MKNFLLLFVIVVINIGLFQSCDTIYAPQPATIEQYDSARKVIGYNWNSVDTSHGFVRIPTNVLAVHNDAGCPLLDGQQEKEIDTMLISFQNHFHVRVISFQLKPMTNDGNNTVDIQAFFETSVDPKLEKLEEAYQEAIDQTQELYNLVDDLSASNRQMKKEFKLLKKEFKELKEKFEDEK